MPEEAETPSSVELAHAYRRHASGVARLIVSYTGDRDVADDLVNETFLRALESAGTFEARSDLAAWLRGIALNVARAYVTKSSRRRRIDKERPSPAREAGAEADRELRDRRAVERLYSAIHELDEPLRDAFVLCVLEELPLNEASAMTGTPVSTLHRRKQRAAALVRARLEGGT